MANSEFWNQDVHLVMCNLCRRYGLVLLTGLLVGGCGGEQIVSVNGTVRRDGQALSQGSINLAPVGGGRPATTAIGADGTFELAVATERGKTNVSYYVTIASELVQKKSTRKVLFVGPRDKPLQIEVDGENRPEIDIDEKEGWKVVSD